MIRGLYTAASGMLSQQAVQDALASNLANINTVGFKQDVPTFKAIHQMALRRHEGNLDSGTPVGALDLCVEFDANATDYTDGTLQPTRNSYDMALVGRGFFSVQTANGERYTRDGEFHLATSGKQTYLATASGDPVLGKNGKIDLTGAKDVVVNSDGTISADGKLVDQLKIVDAAPAALQKQGANLYAISGATMPAKATVRQGYLEQSNVNAVGSMVKMITVQRAYEAAQKAIVAQDESLNKVISEAGRA